MIHVRARQALGDVSAATAAILDKLAAPVGGWDKYRNADMERTDDSIERYVGNRLREMVEIREIIEDASPGEAKLAAVAALRLVSKPFGGWEAVFKAHRPKITRLRRSYRAKKRDKERKAQAKVRALAIRSN